MLPVSPYSTTCFPCCSGGAAGAESGTPIALSAGVLQNLVNTLNIFGNQCLHVGAAGPKSGTPFTLSVEVLQNLVKIFEHFGD